MKPNVGMAVVVGIALCGFAAQPGGQAQSPSTNEHESPSPKASYGTAPVQSAFVEFPTMEGPETGATKTANDSTSSTAATSSAPAKTDSSSSESSSTAASPTTISTALKNEAVLKEIA